MSINKTTNSGYTAFYIMEFNWFFIELNGLV